MNNTNKIKGISLAIMSIVGAGAIVISEAYGGAYLGTHYDVVSGHVHNVYTEGGPEQNITFTPKQDAAKQSDSSTSKKTVNVNINDINDTHQEFQAINTGDSKTDADGYPVNGSTVDAKPGTFKVVNAGPSTPITYYAAIGNNLCKVSKSQYNKLQKAYNNDTIVDPMICHKA